MTPSIPRLAREAIELAHQVNAREHTISEAFVREPKPIEVLARYVEDTAAIVEAAVRYVGAMDAANAAFNDELTHGDPDPWIPLHRKQAESFDTFLAAVRAYRAKGAT